MKWTDDQAKAIYEKNNNILVAAAAGSGKTAVLVERIIQKILNENIDIDKLLVVTFTNAAASEMRERVLDAIYKRLDECPDDENLRKQTTLLSKSNICTIHSFCLNVIRNNFFEVDLSANFRIASEQEVELLKQECMEEVFERLYENEDSNFIKLIQDYTGYKGDDIVKEILFDIYNISQSMPFPKVWLNESVEMFNTNDEENQNFSESIWGKILVENVKEEMFDCINNLRLLKSKLDRFPEMQKFSQVISSDIIQIKYLYDAMDDWDKAYTIYQDFKLDTWPQDKKAIQDLKDEAKNVRNTIKDRIKNIVNKTFLYNTKEAYEDIYMSYRNLKTLVFILDEFDNLFREKKRNKNIIDFSDIEHYALKILVKEKDGEMVPSDVAKKYQEKFVEIAIDEYQDSNQVQETILKSVSRGNNLFMVGDVKQSIYKFRQACPKLFLDKYEKYSSEGNEFGKKIQLFKNFRSSEFILNIVNNIFENIMCKKLGDIDYTQEEFLNLGADYPVVENGLGKSEIHLIDLCEVEEQEDVEQEDEIEAIDEDNTIENDVIEKEEIDKIEVEAIFVRNKIQELIKEKKQVKRKDGTFKNIEYRDIVILLRSTSYIASIFEKELVKNDIPVFSDASNEYLETIEIQTIMSLLRLLDNPYNDINVVAVMRSPIGGFTDNEILKVRLDNRNTQFYYNLLNIKNNENHELNKKVKLFVENIEKWKKESQFCTLSELIWKIYNDTEFLNFTGLMVNGELRKANLKMLFERAKEYEKTCFSGLFSFIKYIEKLKSTNSDMSSAKIISDNENVVRIMSIHKSKGLEFPVVFLSASNKQINMKDLTKNIMLHSEIGFGPQYINYERRIQYPTAAKQSIKIVTKNETISEEMRILYVALTRAKEKMIITGTIKDVQKNIKSKKENLEMYENIKSKNINYILIKKQKSYLDWILMVYLKGMLDNEIEMFIHNKNDFISEEQHEEKEFIFDFDQEINEKVIEEEFSFEYSDKDLINLPLKTSVSELKSSNKNNYNMVLESLQSIVGDDNKEISNARKGTIIHFILQKLDFRKCYTKSELEYFVEQLVLKKLITEEEKNSINIELIMNFIENDMYTRIMDAKIIEKERTFCINYKMDNNDNKKVLVQGIIDLYFIDKNDKLVLIDYKTDIVKSENELIDKYKLQLEIYNEALENSLEKKVDEVYIYSMFLKKFIKINL